MNHWVSLVWLIVAVWLQGCWSSGISSDDGSDCSSGEVEIGDQCRFLCTSDDECEDDEACTPLDEGSRVCVAVEEPECHAATDCVDPPVCGEAAGECRAGVCSYAPVAAQTPCDDGDPCTENDRCDAESLCAGTQLACITPPDPECTPDNGFLATYAAAGYCNPGEGDCIYPLLSTTPCTNCRLQCLGECGSDPECVYLPGPVVCFGTPSCNNGHCTYPVPNGDLQCGAANCINGSVTRARICTADGTCPSTGQQYCDGLACAPGGIDCLVSCSGKTDCLPGYMCVGGDCDTDLHGPGENCFVNEDCTTGYCADEICCLSECNGTCDLCNSEGVCVLDESLCIGNCDYCGEVTPGGYDCSGDDTVCTGNCDFCDEKNPDEFSCAAITDPDPSPCDGSCATCQPIIESHFDCAADDDLCAGNCDLCVELSEVEFACTAHPDHEDICTGCAECRNPSGVWQCEPPDEADRHVCQSCAVDGTHGTLRNHSKCGEDPAKGCVRSACRSCNGAGACRICGNHFNNNRSLESPELPGASAPCTCDDAPGDKCSSANQCIPQWWDWHVIGGYWSLESSTAGVCASTDGGVCENACERDTR